MYLPTDPTQLVRAIVVDSGRPLQSAKKVPIMVSFVVEGGVGERSAEEEGEGGGRGRSVQRCIFKVRVLGRFEMQPKHEFHVDFGSDALWAVRASAPRQQC